MNNIPLEVKIEEEMPKIDFNFSEKSFSIEYNDGHTLNCFLKNPEKGFGSVVVGMPYTGNYEIIPIYFQKDKADFNYSAFSKLQTSYGEHKREKITSLTVAKALKDKFHLAEVLTTFYRILDERGEK